MLSESQNHSSYNMVELSDIVRRRSKTNRMDKNGLLRRTIVEERDEDEYDMLDFDSDALDDNQVDALRDRKMNRTP